MSYDLFDRMASFRAMWRHMFAFGATETYRSVLGPMSIASPMSKIFTDYENTMLGAASLNRSVLECFASNWDATNSTICSGTFENLDFRFESRGAVRSALDALDQPRFEPFRENLLADFAFATSALKTHSDISVGLREGSILAIHGQSLIDTYASFVEELGTKAIAAAIGAAGPSAVTTNLE